jgi:transposase
VQAAVIAELRSTNASPQARVAELEGRVAELEARLRANSSNSSRPPSSDGLGKGPGSAWPTCWPSAEVAGAEA